MKKIILTISLFMIMMFGLTGCAKLINTEYKNVEVSIVGKYHRPVRMVNKAVQPALHRITVEYDGVQYNVVGNSTYNKYKNMVGQTAMGTLEIRTYDDGTVKYDIVELD